MSASGNRNQKSKDQVIHIGGVNHPLFVADYHGVIKHISDYCGFSYSPAWFNFFSSPATLEEEILMLARYGAPLATVEAYVMEAYTKKEKHLPVTLIKATVQAVRDGDVTLRDDKNVILCEGMAEKLMALCKVLDKTHPGIFAECMKQARLAAPFEDETQRETRENLNQDAVRQVFDAIQKNDDKTTDAIKTFKEWAGKTSVINRIHLIFVAREELANRGHELPPVNLKDRGKWYGVLGDQFCYEVIGDALQADLPPHMKRALAVGLYYIFNRTKELVRVNDPDGVSASFINPADGWLLGLSCFYSEFGPVAGGGRRRGGEFLQNLLRAITAALRSYYTPTASTPCEPVSDNVEIRRSPSAIAAGR